MADFDGRPGFYYVVVRRPNDAGGFEHRPLRGPFNTHKAANDALPEARDRAVQFDPECTGYTFGVGRCAQEQGPGIFDIMDRRAKAGSTSH